MSNFYVSLSGREAKLLGVITCLSIMHALTFFADKNEQVRPSHICRVAKVFSFTNPILQLREGAQACKLPKRRLICLDIPLGMERFRLLCFNRKRFYFVEIEKESKKKTFLSPKVISGSDAGR